MKFRARSYAMGAAIAVVDYTAATYAGARTHPKVRALPAGAQGDRGKVQVIGIEVRK